MKLASLLPALEDRRCISTSRADEAIAERPCGEADVLRVEELPVPEPGSGQVAIDVAFAGANYAEILFRRGAVDVPLPYVPGIEVCGHIRALGPGLSGLQPGQPVAALTIVSGGGYAEVAVTDAQLVAALPTPASQQRLQIAAGLPSNSTTALLVLDEVARLRDGETVLVHAAAGGVGSQLGQAARLAGAGRVVGSVGSADKLEAARSLGYDDVIIRDELQARLRTLTDGAGFDVVVDPVGGSTRRASFQSLAIGGRLVAMGNASNTDDVDFGANELWFSGKAVMGFNLAALSAEPAGPRRAGSQARRRRDDLRRSARRRTRNDPARARGRRPPDDRERDQHRQARARGLGSS